MENIIEMKIEFNSADQNKKEIKTYTDKVEQLLEEIARTLEAPYYATRVFVENEREILEIVEHLEKEIELLKRR